MNGSLRLAATMEGKGSNILGAGPKAVNRPSIDTVSTSGGATSRAPATGEPKGGRSSAAHQATAIQPRLCATRITGRSAWRKDAVRIFTHVLRMGRDRDDVV